MSNSGHLDTSVRHAGSFSPTSCWCDRCAKNTTAEKVQAAVAGRLLPNRIALPGVGPVVAIVATDLMPCGEGLPVKRLRSKQLGTSASLECCPMAIRTRCGISFGVIRMAADPRLPHRMHTVRTARAGNRERARVAYRALGHSPGISLEVGAVHGVIGLIRRELSVLRSVASRALRRTVSLAEPVQAEAGGWGVRSGGKPRICARALRSCRTDVRAGESS